MSRRKLFQADTEESPTEKNYLEEISKINEYLISTNVVPSVPVNLESITNNEKEIDNLYKILLKNEILNEDQCKKLNQLLITNNAIIFNFIKIINLKDNKSFNYSYKIDDSTLEKINNHISDFCKKIIAFHNKNILVNNIYEVLSRDTELLSNIYKYYKSKSVPSLQFCIVEKLLDICTEHANVVDNINSTLGSIDRLNSLFKTLKIIKEQLAISIDTKINDSSNIDVDKSENIVNNIYDDDVKIFLDNLPFDQSVQLSGDC